MAQHNPHLHRIREMRVENALPVMLSTTGAPTLRSTLRPSGLAAWQTKRIVTYIEANLGSKIAIRQMADLVALSESRFSRAFKQSLGSSPMAYVRLRRVERATLMMTFTSEPLMVIALACGFTDQPHFNKYFRRVVGMSPGLWRRMSEYNSLALGLAHQAFDEQRLLEDAIADTSVRGVCVTGAFGPDAGVVEILS